MLIYGDLSREFATECPEMLTPHPGAHKCNLTSGCTISEHDCYFTSRGCVSLTVALDGRHI